MHQMRRRIPIIKVSHDANLLGGNHHADETDRFDDLLGGIPVQQTGKIRGTVMHRFKYFVTLFYYPPPQDFPEGGRLRAAKKQMEKTRASSKLFILTASVRSGLFLHQNPPFSLIGPGLVKIVSRQIQREPATTKP